MKTRLGRTYDPYRYGDKPPKVGDIVIFKQEIIHENKCGDPNCKKTDSHNAGDNEIRMRVTKVINPCTSCEGRGWFGGHSGSDGVIIDCSVCDGRGWFALHEKV